MKDKKLQIFVSSTYVDLRFERQAAVEAILSSGHIPAGMELFAAGDESQMTVIERWIDESDIYLLIMGGRYGSIDIKSGKSYTQLEYEYAISKKKPLFAVVITEKALDEKLKKDGKIVIEQEYPKELQAFKSIVLSNLVKFWDDSKDIKIAIHETLSELSYRKELTGWIRGDNSINTGFLAEEIAKLTKENSELRERLNGLNSNSTALYSTLSFSELKNLLEKDTSEYNGTKMNLYQLLIELATEFSKGFTPPSGFDHAGLNKLQTYKLIVDKGGSSAYDYFFTEDGHNFYLKLLASEK